jgi:ribosomal protein S18 acetylase RimI-like enzyme
MTRTTSPVATGRASRAEPAHADPWPERDDRGVTGTVADVVALERLAARSWRGLEQRPYGDWLLRAGGGFTGRANSVLVVGDPPEDLPAAVATVTDWYSRRGLRPRAQLPMPGAEQADEALAAAGWTRDDDVLVLTAPLAGWNPPRTAVDLAPLPDTAWLAGYRYRGTPLPAVAYDVLVNADDPVFAAIRCDPEPAPLAAVARGVLVDGRLCVTAVTVDERYRRLGLATAVMAALGGWARDRGGQSCLLQVAAGNDPALALYDRLGFTEHHRYHYRLGAVPGPPVTG